MKLSEAYSILELSSNASPEEAKKKYRSLTKKYHPDLNKEPDAEDKFKKINEAYECVKSGKGNEPEYNSSHNHQSWSMGIDLNDLFGQHRSQQHRIRNESNIALKASISFKESVLGHKHNLSYKRKVKCESCDGSGSKLINNGCSECGGQGVIITRQGNMITQRACHKCHGRHQSENCAECKTNGFLEVETSISVNIPAGISNGQTLRLQHMGNYSGSVSNFMGMSDMYTDANLSVCVEDSNGMSIVGSDVISHLNISLYDALQGCSKNVITIDGEKSININCKSKNKDEVIIPKLGLNKVGNHRVILNVEYPENVEDLIKYLNKDSCQSL